MNKSVSRYLADLIAQEARNSQDALAIEGYQALAQETLKFARHAFPTAPEVWWDDAV